MSKSPLHRGGQDLSAVATEVSTSLDNYKKQLGNVPTRAKQLQAITAMSTYLMRPGKDSLGTIRSHSAVIIQQAGLFAIFKQYITAEMRAMNKAGCCYSIAPPAGKLQGWLAAKQQSFDVVENGGVQL